MSKKIVILLAVMAALCASAQTAVGDWIIHTSFVGNQVKNVVESHKWVYYLSGANLFRLDKSTQENEALSRMNYMTDMGISQVYYNSDNDYLVVVYTNSNIDVILSDGRVVNMPEIKNAVMTSSKAINDVTFASGVMYVATDFGYVVIDDKLLVSTPEASYYGDADEYYEQLEAFEPASFYVGSRLWPISDSTFFCMGDSTVWSKMSFDDEGEAKFSSDTIITNRTTVVQKTKGGYLLNVPQLKKCYKTDETGLNLVGTDTDGELCSANPEGDGSFWAAGVNGLHQMVESESYFMPPQCLVIWAPLLDDL